MSSTSDTAPESSHSVERTSPTDGRSGSAMKPRPAFDCGYRAARLRPTTSSSDCASASVAPGRGRAQTAIPGCTSRRRITASVFCPSGVSTSASRRLKAAGATPTSVYGVASNTS